MRIQYDIERGENSTSMNISETSDGYIATIQTDDKCLWNAMALESVEKTVRSAKIFKKAFNIIVSGGVATPICESLGKLGFVEGISTDGTRCFSYVPKEETRRKTLNAAGANPKQKYVNKGYPAKIIARNKG